MKRRLALLGAVAVGLTLFSSTPFARASLHDACVEVLGSAQLSSPLTYPVIGQSDSYLGLPPSPLVTVSPHSGSPHSAAFVAHFITGACVPSGTQLSATGTVHGWCGLSVGEGITSLGDDFHWAGVGSILVLTGEAAGIGHVEANFLGGESCLTGADNFLVSFVTALSSCPVPLVTSAGASLAIPSANVSTPALSASVLGARVHAQAHVSTHGSVHPRVSVCV